MSKRPSSAISSSRRLRLLAALAALSLTTVPAPAWAQDTPDSDDPTTDPSEPEPEPPVLRTMVFPVVGPVSYVDTWGACRGSGCSRSHKGVDIFGAKLAPLVAAADGTITSVRRSSTTISGNTVVVTDDEGWRYVYVHLNNDSPGTDDHANPQAWIIPNDLRVGDRVNAGDVIGYLGDSGNAETTPAHLHFELHEPGEGAVNPTPSVDKAQAENNVVPVSNLASTAAERAQHQPLISAWYRALLKREPTNAELLAWSDRFAIGFGDRNTLIADLTMAPQRSGPAGSVMRTFHLALGRAPSHDELRSTEDVFRSGGTDAVAAAIIATSEFEARHGSLDDDAFIDVVYGAARGRAPTDSVREYWQNEFDNGRPRAEMLGYFADSYGVKDALWHELEVMQAFRAALDRMPSDAEYSQWVSHLDSGGLIFDVVDAIKP